MPVDNTKFYVIPCSFCLQPAGRACQYLGRDGQHKYVGVHSARVRASERHVTERKRLQCEALESLWSGVQQ